MHSAKGSIPTEGSDSGAVSDLARQRIRLPISGLRPPISDLRSPAQTSSFRPPPYSVTLCSIMLRGMDRWLLGYLGSLLRRPRGGGGVRHLMVAVCDHYEPYRDGVDQATARGHVDRWVREFPAMAEPFRDADGRMPQHTFFYPEEEYDPACLEQLGRLMQQGCGEVEIHLHHRNDTAEGLREKLVRFRDLLHREHGMLGCRKTEVGGRKPEKGERSSRPPISELRSPTYGFIHGNWSLCNSRPDGDWCGVNEELGVLAETGCYADLTFPSAPSPTQPRMVNAIYRASDRPEGRGHDSGVRVRVSGKEERGGSTCKSTCTSTDADTPTTISGGQGEGHAGLSGSVLRTGPAKWPSPWPERPLLLIQGPLGLNFARRKWGVLPRIENGEISGSNWPTSDRARLWAKTGIHVAGRPEWVFVKLHTHGCVPANSDVLLGKAMGAMHTSLQQHFNDGTAWQLHYVTSREMVNIILAAEDGHSGNPGQYRDYAVSSPPLVR